MSSNLDKTLADELEALKFGVGAGEYRDPINLKSLRHYRTKLLCRCTREHGLQDVTGIIEGSLTVTLACGCTREIGKRTARTARGKVAA